MCHSLSFQTSQHSPRVIPSELRAHVLRPCEWLLVYRQPRTPRESKSMIYLVTKEVRLLSRSHLRQPREYPQEGLDLDGAISRCRIRERQTINERGVPERVGGREWSAQGIVITYLNGRIILILFQKAMRFLSALILLLLPLACVSWWDVGHMLTAAIAEAKLLK